MQTSTVSFASVGWELPSSTVDRRNCEVYPDFINADRLAIANGNDHGITLCSEPCMDFSVALNQSAEAEATPDAWRPPTSLIAPDPVLVGAVENGWITHRSQTWGCRTIPWVAERERRVSSIRSAHTS